MSNSGLARPCIPRCYPGISPDLATHGDVRMSLSRERCGRSLGLSSPGESPERNSNPPRRASAALQRAESGRHQSRPIGLHRAVSRDKGASHEGALHHDVFQPDGSYRGGHSDRSGCSYRQVLEQSKQRGGLAPPGELPPADAQIARPTRGVAGRGKRRGSHHAAPSNSRCSSSRPRSALRRVREAEPRTRRL